MSLFRVRRCVAVSAVTAALAFPAVTTAHAASYTSTGERCTIVGTSRTDVLNGTSGRDVICGLGGDDVVRGGGGNDVLDGGSGRDRIAGDSGDDRIFGGGGNDTMYGGPGADRIDGGTDNDRAVGDTGKDSVAGGSGNDVISGGDGTDRLYGGPSNDTLLGGDDSDYLYGDTGNDDLDGQQGGDSLDGGDGTNWCTIGAADVQKACVYDRTPPRVLEVQALPGVVDVSQSAQQFRLRMHVVDDTGANWVWPVLSPAGRARGSVSARLVSGNGRDGWWEATVYAPRYAHPGSVDADVWFTDRVGRETSQRVVDVVQVVNDDPDLDHPVVSNVQITPGKIDIRTQSVEVTVSARVVDPKAGLDARDKVDGGGAPEAQLWGPTLNGDFAPLHYAPMVLASGNRFDGVWRGGFLVDRGQLGGTWSAAIGVNDSTFGNPHSYVGPTLWNHVQENWQGGSAFHSRIEGADLEVIGPTEFDRTPPRLTAARIDRTSVDTLQEAQSVVVDVDVSDVGDGVERVQATFLSQSGDDLWGYAYLESGTANDGTWRMGIGLPRGTPPGRYVLTSIVVSDRFNHSSFPAPNDAFTTADGSNWDGVITVVDNPAAG